jgi:hypothetical protein
LIGAVEKSFATQTDALEETTITTMTAMTVMEEMTITMTQIRTMERSSSAPWTTLISPDAKLIKIFGYGT